MVHYSTYRPLPQPYHHPMAHVLGIISLFFDMTLSARTSDLVILQRSVVDYPSRSTESWTSSKTRGTEEVQTFLTMNMDA